MKQADVPAWAHQAQEFQQGAGALRKDKTQQALVLRQFGVAPDHVADVLLGQFVVRQIECVKALLAEVGGDFGGFAFAVGGQAHKHMGAIRVADAVVEFRHVARAARQVADQLTKAFEAAAFFRNRHGKQRFTLFAHLGALGHKTQPVKVHVGAAQNGGVGFAFGLVAGHVLLDGSDGQRARGLHNAAGVHEHVLDGRTHGIGVDDDELVHQFAGDAKGLFAHQFHRRAVREQSDVGQRQPFLGRDGLRHGIRIIHLHPDDLDLRAHRLDVIGHARNQAAAANRDKHGIQPIRAMALQLAQHFHGDRALAGNHVRVVKRVDKGQPLLFFQHRGVAVGIGIAVAMQHHFAAKAAHGIHFELRCGGRHHDHGPRAQLLRAQRHTLRMVAGRGANHPFLQLLGRQVRHLVVGAAQLETVHRLLVFALEQHGVVQAPAQGFGRFQGGLHRHVIDAGGQDLFQVVGGFEGFSPGVGRHVNSVGYRVVWRCLQAFQSGAVDPVFVAFAGGDHGHEDFRIVHAVNQPVAQAVQFDFVAVCHALQCACGDARMIQSFGQFFLQGLANTAIELMPFPQGLFMKAQLIAHRDRLRQMVRWHARASAWHLPGLQGKP